MAEEFQETPETAEEPISALTLPEAASRLCNVPLLIERSRLEPIIASMRTAQGIDPQAFFFLFEEGAAAESELFELRGGAAVIPVHGPLSSREDFLSRMFDAST